MDYKSFFYTSGISLMVSSVVVLANNYYLYRHACKKSNNTTQVCNCVESEKTNQN